MSNPEDDDKCSVEAVNNTSPLPFYPASHEGIADAASVSSADCDNASFGLEPIVYDEPSWPSEDKNTSSNRGDPPASIYTVSSPSPGMSSTSIPRLSVPQPKRHRSESRTLSGDNSDASDSNEYRARRRRHRRLNNSGPKEGSSWARQKALKAKALKAMSAKASFELNDSSLKEFRNKILAIDRHAQFDDGNPLRVRCSSCAEWRFMRVLYDVQRWHEHRSTKLCRKNQQRGLVNTSIRNFFSPKAKTPSLPTTATPTPAPTPALSPCPGITRESNIKVARYLKRSMGPGGGAPSRTAIAQELFGSDAVYAALLHSEKRAVLRREESRFKWRNSRSTGAVFSSTCAKNIPTPPGSRRLMPCSECQDLLRLHTFQVQLNKPPAPPSKMKFIPKDRRDGELGEIYLKIKGVRDLVEMVCVFVLRYEKLLSKYMALQNDGRSPWLKFACGVVDGLYAKQEVVLGMIDALVKKTERLAAGKTLRNMSYSPAFNNFCNLLASTSTRAYKTFKRQFGGRGIRSMR